MFKIRNSAKNLTCHLSLNFTVVSGKMVATTPSFFGANPAEVKQGELQGLRVLSAEEDKARELLLSLDERQRAAAIFDSKVPPDILRRHRTGEQTKTNQC